MTSPVAPTHHTALPPAPSLDDPAGFDSTAETFADALEPLADEMDALADNAFTNATASAESAVAAAASELASAGSAGASAGSATASGNSATAAAGSAASALNAPGTSATSTTSLAIGTGSKSLTIQTGKAFAVGQTVGIARTSNPDTHFMIGVITAHDSSTGAMTVAVNIAVGSGTYTAWTIALAANVGAIAVFAGDGGSGGSQGLVPAPSAGDGGARKVLRADGTWGSAPYAPDVILQDQKSTGTAGDALTSGSWNTRTINTVVRNIGSLASLSSNVVTLPAGTWLLRVRAAYNIGLQSSSNCAFATRIRNTSDGVTVGLGAPAHVGALTTGFYTDGGEQEVVAIVTLSGSKTFEVQTRPSVTNTIAGYSGNGGETEVYLTFEATKIG